MADIATQTFSPPPSTAAPQIGESYWSLVLRQLHKNRSSIISFYFVLALSLLAIAAPFLAGNAPIVMVASFPGVYQDRFEEWKLGGHPELVAALSNWGPGHSTVESDAFSRRLQTVQRELDVLASQLHSSEASRLEKYRQEYGSVFHAVESGNRKATPEELQKLDSLYQDISQNFDPSRVHLASKIAWPVIEQLRWLDFFFMGLALTTLLSPVVVPKVKRYFPAALRKGARPYLAFIGIPTILLALYGMTRFIPVDTSDYKQDLFNGRIQSSMALFPPVQYGVNEAHLGDKYRAPDAAYWMGTDGNGRDLLTRMIWGARISLSVGFVAVAIYTFLGMLVGTFAGYYRGWVDMVLSRIIEIFICFPAFFLILAVLAFLQPSILNIMIVIGITGWTSEARLVRGEFLRLNDQEFVLAAKALGVSDLRIIFRHILPNAIAPLLVSASFGIATAILIESSLSFLGFGISIPVPSWGGILNEARENFRYWWITMYPGVAIFAAVTAYNLLGEGVRDAMDPRLKP